MLISCDQGATNITGYFLYFGGISYDFASWQGDNWLLHVDDVKNKIIQHQPKLFIFEDARQYATNKKGFATYHYRNVVKAGGAVEYICHDLKVKSYGITNANEWRTQEKAKAGGIPGLERKKLKGLKGWPKNEWYFKGRMINEHEKDALLLFFMFCEKSKKPWPWIN